MKNVEKSKKRKRSDTLATRNIERTLPRKRGTRGGLEYFRFHRKTSCSLPSSPPSSPGLLFVCLGYSTRHPRVCHSSFVTDPFFSFFFFFLSFSSRSRIFPRQFDFSNVFLLASSIARLGKKKSGPMGRRGESQFIETAAAFPSSFSLTVAISHRTFRNEVTFIFASFG